MSLQEYFNYIILPLLVLSVLLVFVRFLIGPSIADRVIALDMLILTAIGIIAVYSMQNNQDTFLDIAMLFALIAFLGTVAFAYYLVQRKNSDE